MLTETSGANQGNRSEFRRKQANRRTERHVNWKYGLQLTQLTPYIYTEKIQDSARFQIGLNFQEISSEQQINLQAINDEWEQGVNFQMQHFCWIIERNWEPILLNYSAKMVQFRWIIQRNQFFFFFPICWIIQQNQVFFRGRNLATLVKTKSNSAE